MIVTHIYRTHITHIPAALHFHLILHLTQIKHAHLRSSSTNSYLLRKIARLSSKTWSSCRYSASISRQLSMSCPLNHPLQESQGSSVTSLSSGPPTPAGTEGICCSVSPTATCSSCERNGCTRPIPLKVTGAKKKTTEYNLFSSCYMRIGLNVLHFRNKLLKQTGVMCIIVKTYCWLTLSTCKCHVRAVAQQIGEKLSAVNGVALIILKKKKHVCCIIKFLHPQGKATNQPMTCLQSEYIEKD